MAEMLSPSGCGWQLLCGGRPALPGVSGGGGNRPQLWPDPALAYFHMQGFCGEEPHAKARASHHYK